MCPPTPAQDSTRAKQLANHHSMPPKILAATSGRSIWRLMDHFVLALIYRFRLVSAIRISAVSLTQNQPCIDLLQQLRLDRDHPCS